MPSHGEEETGRSGVTAGVLGSRALVGARRGWREPEVELGVGSFVLGACCLLGYRKPGSVRCGQEDSREGPALACPLASSITVNIKCLGKSVWRCRCDISLQGNRGRGSPVLGLQAGMEERGRGSCFPYR